MARFIAIGEASFNAGEDQETLTRRLHDEVVAHLAGVAPEIVAQFELATPSYMAAMGLTRYYTKRVT